jgi:hypothetical protein
VFGISNFRYHPLLTSFVNCSDELGQDPSWVGLPHSPTTAQITLSSVMLRISLCVVGCFCAYEMRLTFFNHSRHLMLPTCVLCFIKNKLPCLYAFWCHLVVLLLRFHKFFEQTRRFALTMNSDVRDSGVSGRLIAPILITNGKTRPHITIKKIPNKIQYRRAIRKCLYVPTNQYINLVDTTVY